MLEIQIRKDATAWPFEGALDAGGGFAGKSRFWRHEPEPPRRSNRRWIRKYNCVRSHGWVFRYHRDFMAERAAPTAAPTTKDRRLLMTVEANAGSTMLIIRRRRGWQVICWT